MGGSFSPRITRDFESPHHPSSLRNSFDYGKISDSDSEVQKDSNSASSSPQSKSLIAKILKVKDQNQASTIESLKSQLAEKENQMNELQKELKDSSLLSWKSMNEKL